jgi:hypothetical protein
MRVLVVCLVATVVVVAVAARAIWRAWAADQPSAWSAIEASTPAVASGDREALEAVVAGGPAHDALISRHAGRPATATSVQMDMTESSVWWSVSIRYELPGQEPATEHLFVGPRDDSPDHELDYRVSAAPSS